MGIGWSIAVAALSVSLVPSAAFAEAPGPVADLSAASVATGTENDDGVPIDVTVPESTDPPETATGTVDDAQFRWGLNRESSGGAFAGGCNFLSAGRAGDTGGARVWGAGDGLYASESGNVEIVKATSGGDWERASFATKCLDAAGNTVTAASTASTTDSQVVFTGGSGTFGPDGVELRWTGSFTVAFYGGMTYWSATDPVLRIDSSGNGRLEAELSGYGTSMEDMTKWEPIPARTVVLAELRNVPLGSAGGSGGFEVLPEYLGVDASGAGQSPRTDANAAYWGAFPASFIGFQKLTGQTGYWLTSGGQRDVAKPATTLVVNADARAPAIVPTAGSSGTSSSAVPQNDAVFAPISTTAPVPPATAPGAGQPWSTVQRAPTGLVPEAADVLPPLVIPLGGTLLCVLVSALSALHLAGRLRFPWSRSV